jgi:OOP family OmpA-OmpF porin
LVARGVPEERLIAEGFGVRRPIADDETEEGKRKNRRVEFDIIE